MKLFKITILALTVAMFAFTACDTYDNSLSGTNWEAVAQRNVELGIDTMYRYEFTSANHGRHLLRFAEEKPVNGSQIDSTVGYSYNEKAGTVTINRQGNNVYRGTIVGDQMTLIWDTFDPSDSVSSTGEPIKYAPDTVVYTRVF